MTTVHHLNCGLLHAPPNPRAACHCLLLEGGGRLVLVDTGIGTRDVADPDGRVGRFIIDIGGFQFHDHLTAVRQLERIGFRPADVTDIVLTHGDPDHVGGLADFPAATVHLSAEEYAVLDGRNPRYRAAQFAHGLRWQLHPPAADRWFGLEARPLPFGSAEVLLIPLFGHTLGHCGVAVRQGGRWLLHVGDAYFLRVELETDDHPVSAVATSRAVDDPGRRESLARLRQLVRDHGDDVQTTGYHDFTEFPPGWVESAADG